MTHNQRGHIALRSALVLPDRCRQRPRDRAVLIESLGCQQLQVGRLRLAAPRTQRGLLGRANLRQPRRPFASRPAVPGDPLDRKVPSRVAPVAFLARVIPVQIAPVPLGDRIHHHPAVRRTHLRDPPLGEPPHQQYPPDRTRIATLVPTGFDPHTDQYLPLLPVLGGKRALEHHPRLRAIGQRIVLGHGSTHHYHRENQTEGASQMHGDTPCNWTEDAEMRRAIVVPGNPRCIHTYFYAISDLGAWRVG